MSAMEKINRVRGGVILSRMLSEGPLEKEASEQRPTGTVVQGIGKSVLAGGNSKAKGYEV